MLTQRMQDALNEQIVAELYSAYLYLAMAAYFEATKWPGMSHWMREQAKEELGHAMKLFDYVGQRGRICLGPVEGPPGEWSSPLAVFEAVLEHEKKVTGLIHRLVEVARTEGDSETEDFLSWFVEEQEEEEESAQKAIDLVSRAQDEEALRAADAELGKR